MTQSIVQLRSRGVGNRSVGGSYSADAQADLIDTDCFQQQIQSLQGTTDAINPHVSGNYVIQSTVADAITLAAPTAGTDDGVTIAIYVDSITLAHTITATALLANGTALKTTATPAQFKGAGMTLRAFNGVWHVISVTACPLT